MKSHLLILVLLTTAFSTGKTNTAFAQKNELIRKATQPKQVFVVEKCAFWYGIRYLKNGRWVWWGSPDPYRINSKRHAENDLEKYADEFREVGQPFRAEVKLYQEEWEHDRTYDTFEEATARMHWLKGYLNGPQAPFNYEFDVTPVRIRTVTVQGKFGPDKTKPRAEIEQPFKNRFRNRFKQRVDR